MQKLGERIRHVRGRMSQEAFAGLLGISKGALGGYERGENCPNADVILTICKKCRINVSWLMSGTGAMQAPEDIAAGGPQEGGPGEPAGERSPADEKTACRVVPGQNEKMENDALRAHCRWLQERLDQLEAERRDLNRYNEVVFCGYGEPACRWDDMMWLCDKIKENGSHFIRINTNGLADLITGRNAALELDGKVDAVSVSLNASTAEGYEAICHSQYGLQAFPAILKFTSTAVFNVPHVRMTVVSTMPTKNTATVLTLFPSPEGASAATVQFSTTMPQP